MQKKQLRREEALEYHSKGKPGKIEVVPTKEAKTQRDLSLAYSPGVAEPCKEISLNKDEVYKYTAKGNLVAVITNGTAVLGLGNIGPEASKPVMEGKGVLFKVFADIDVFDIEINETDPEKFVQIVKSLEPTFGGINLEDIKAPECFYIERQLRATLKIPVMHDDQHGTAIISSAALINALELQKKRIDKVRFVINGAGAAAVACIKLYVALGAKPENFIVFDKDGVLHKGRNDLEEDRLVFAISKSDVTLAKAMVDADVFVGLSVGNVVTPEMIKSMAKKPIVFAMANPDPEITYDAATAVREDLIMATGRSDFPNQVNNVLGFPFIFRGALDVRATQINEAMKLAAVRALAGLAKTPVPDIVNMAYNEKTISFGSRYIIPKPFDPRLLSTVAPAGMVTAIEVGDNEFWMLLAGRVPQGKGFVDYAPRQGRFNAGGRADADDFPAESSLAQSQREASADQPYADDTHHAPGLRHHGYAVLPTAAAIARTCCIISLNCAGVRVCAPSLKARSGSGCTSTIRPSAPAATDARAMGSTWSRRPVPCDGSPTMGRCESFFTTGMAEISMVFRV